jgi:hypothetical protein
VGDFTRWLLHEDQNTLFGVLFAVVLALAFFALAALALWPLDRAAIVLSLAKGYLLFWIVLSLATGLLFVMQRALKVNLYDHGNAYIISALAVSALLQAGWSAFAALVAGDSAAGAPAWVAAILYGLGFVSTYVAHTALSAFYTGAIYRFANLAIAVASFIVFSVWPAAGRTTYGWFFELI